MSQNYQQIQQANVRRQSTIAPVFVVEEEQNVPRRFTTSANIQRRLSTISQIYLPHGDEYHGQQRIPPAGPEFQQHFLLKRVEDLDNRRLSIISQVSRPLEEDFVETKSKEHHRRTLFIMEPIITGLILFPIVVLF
jgi:hypothetical protein